MTKPWPLGSGSVDPTPWPGGQSFKPAPGAMMNQGALVDVAAAKFGQVNLVQVAGQQHPRPLDVKNICSWSSQGAPVPVSAVIATDSKTAVNPTGTNPFAKEFQLLSQLSGANIVNEGDEQIAGVLRITYGIGGQLRTLEADIRAGSYQLPPCDFCQLDAFAFGIGLLDVNVRGGVVPGVLPSSSRLTASALLTLDPAESVQERVPFGARWVAMAGGAPTGTGADQPILKLAQGTSSVFLLHDYQAGSFLSQPGQPVEIFTRDDITITNDGPNLALVTVRFFLEV